MSGVLAGFGVIALVIVAGYALARRGTLGAQGQRVLARLAFSVAMPALLFCRLAESDLHQVFSASLIVTAGSVIVVAGIYVLVARLAWHQDTPGLVVGSFASGYVNGGNLGIPIAAYVLSDASYAIPVMLWQLCIFAPVGMALLDRSLSSGAPTRRFATVGTMVRNPLIVASALGIAVALSPWQAPSVLIDPLELLAGMAVPAALLAFGMSLHGAPRPGGESVRPQIFLVMFLKNAVQPAAAYLIARYGVGLDGTALFAATLFAALPTAQNVFVYAYRYRTSVPLARDAILLTSAISIPVVLGLSALMG